MDVMFPLLAHDMLRKAVLLGAAWAGLPADGGAPGPDGLPAWADGAGGARAPGAESRRWSCCEVAQGVRPPGAFLLETLSSPESCWTPGRDWWAHPRGLWLWLAHRRIAHRLTLSLKASLSKSCHLFAAVCKEIWRVIVKGSNWYPSCGC